jgi:hypothetical protein
MEPLIDYYGSLIALKIIKTGEALPSAFTFLFGEYSHFSLLFTSPRWAYGTRIYTLQGKGKHWPQAIVACFVSSRGFEPPSGFLALDLASYSHPAQQLDDHSPSKGNNLQGTCYPSRLRPPGELNPRGPDKTQHGCPQLCFLFGRWGWFGAVHIANYPSCERVSTRLSHRNLLL